MRLVSGDVPSHVSACNAGRQATACGWQVAISFLRVLRALRGSKRLGMLVTLFLELEGETHVDLSHAGDGRWPAEERRGQRSAVAGIVPLVRQVLRRDEQLHPVPLVPLIEGADLCRSAAAEHADAGWMRRDCAYR